MKIKICKTHEITTSEWEGIVQGFSQSFDRKGSVEKKKSYYSGNIFGYSYHAIALSDNKVVGHTTVIPSVYQINGQDQIVGLSGGTFVIKEFRKNAGLFKQMYVGLREACNKEKMIAILGVPNKNSFRYSIKILKKKHIGNLNYYLLPLRPANLMGLKKLAFFINPVSVFIAKLYIVLFLGFSRLFNPKEQKTPYFIKLTPEFIRYRLKNGYENFLNHKGISSFFKIDNENGKKIAYLMEFNNNGIQDLKSLSLVIWQLINNHKIDTIVWIGTLRLRPRPLIKLPQFLEPKPLPLTSEILPYGRSIVNEDSFHNFRNWKFSLINFDVK